MRSARVLVVVITADHQLPEGFARCGRRRNDAAAARRSRIAELRALCRLPLARRAAARLLEHTDGNPLHVRAWLEQVPGDLYAPLPAPRSYESMVLDRLAECAPDGRLLMEAASVLGRSCALYEAAGLNGIEDPLQAVEEATTTGLLKQRRTPAGLEIWFPHPLIQAAVYQGLGPAQRTRLHLSTTAKTADEPAQLLHRFLAANRPDEGLAAEFETTP